MEKSDFRILAKDRQLYGFDWEKEGSWTGPFTFIQAADTQFGMIQNLIFKDKDGPNWDKEIVLTEKAVAAINNMHPKPRFFVICGDLVDAMPGIAYKADQIRDLKKVLVKLDPDIAPVCVCGNHDIGDTPTIGAIEQYQRDFGDDYFSFWVGGVKFVVLNSQFYHDDTHVKDLRREHDLWLDQQLVPDSEKPSKHIIGLQHIAPFVLHPDEEAVDVPGNPDLKFNIGDKTVRRQLLEKLKRAGMTKLFCGHYHRNAGGWDDNLEVVVTSAIGCQLGSDAHGLRVVKVLEDRIEHQYYTLDDIPETVKVP